MQLIYDENGNIDIHQPAIGCWTTSFNPDDEMFYVQSIHDELTYATFKQWHDAVVWCQNN